MPSPLAVEIRRRIELAGPMPVSEYMALCLSHPVHGYYMTRDPLGRAGDFVTAPEISQMFGELIGLWAATVWRLMGEPQVQLVELGPGRGTLMRDVLRATRVVPGFHAAAAVHLVEISPVLERQQRAALAGVGLPVHWHAALEEVPQAPLLVIANEFFDALPVRQAVKQPDGWCERVVRIDHKGDFAFALAANPIPHFARLLPPQVRDAPVGALYEWREHRIALELGRRLARAGGAALVIDYGHGLSAVGETLQAVSGHAYADPLAVPGAVDLTAHVDFQALAQAVESMGARTHGPRAQGDFLRRLGIEARAAALKAAAAPAQAAAIDAALERLTGVGKSGMGRLFKAIAFSAPQLAELPGFER